MMNSVLEYPGGIRYKNCLEYCKGSLVRHVVATDDSNDHNAVTFPVMLEFPGNSVVVNCVSHEINDLVNMRKKYPGWKVIRQVS